MSLREPGGGGTRNLAPHLARAALAASGLLGAVALLANPWILGPLLVPDGRITHIRPLVMAEAALAILAVAAFVISRRLSRRIAPIPPRTVAAAFATAGITLAFCVGTAELAVRATMNPGHTLTPNTDAWWEYRWRSEHQLGDSLLTRPKYGSDTFDPELGWAPRPEYRSGRVTVNAEGIRAVRSYTQAPPEDVRRVVIVGDSYAWGENVTNAETFAAQMESVATGLEVVNLGVHGYGTDQQLLRLRRDGLPLSPDVVVLAIFGQNVHRNVLRFRDYAKPRFVLEKGALTLEERELPAPEALLARPQRLPFSRLASLTHRALTNAVARSTLSEITLREKWRVTEAILAAAWSESERAGAEFLLVYVPWTVQATPLELERPIAAWASSSHVPFLNLREAFVALPVEEHDALYGGHWTPLGHRRAAEAIVARILPDAAPH